MKVQHWMAMALVAVTSVACADTTGPLAAGEVDEARAAASLRAASSPTIVDVAVSVNGQSGEFSTLIAAVVAADLVDALSAVGQRTVFAPTDEAFAALGLDASNIGSLPKETLTNILLYHVAPGRRYAEDVVSSDRIRMSNGGFTMIRLENGAAYINDSQIVATDVEASNGLIHVIDAVLLP
jgi:transforming growth factor-beta-induced protein